MKIDRVVPFPQFLLDSPGIHALVEPKDYQVKLLLVEQLVVFLPVATDFYLCYPHEACILACSVDNKVACGAFWRIFGDRAFRNWHLQRFFPRHPYTIIERELTPWSTHVVIVRWAITPPPFSLCVCLLLSSGHIEYLCSFNKWITMYNCLAFYITCIINIIAT